MHSAPPLEEHVHEEHFHEDHVHGDHVHDDHIHDEPDTLGVFGSSNRNGSHRGSGSSRNGTSVKGDQVVEFIDDEGKITRREKEVKMHDIWGLRNEKIVVTMNKIFQPTGKSGLYFSRWLADIANKQELCPWHVSDWRLVHKSYKENLKKLVRAAAKKTEGREPGELEMYIHNHQRRNGGYSKHSKSKEFVDDDIAYVKDKTGCSELSKDTIDVEREAVQILHGKNHSGRVFGYGHGVTASKLDMCNRHVEHSDRESDMLSIELAATKEKLHNAEEKLHNAEEKLQQTQEKLHKAEEDVANTKEEMAKTREEMANMKQVQAAFMEKVNL